jgi:methyl-accepting chemotaxis protein
VALLKRLTYGAGGYFWGYDSRAVQGFPGHQRRAHRRGLSGYQDPKGVYAIRELVRAGQDGSHYVHYSFTLPGSSQIVPKIGYAHYLPKWNLVFGTSLNLDDIERDVQKAREAFQARINDLMLIMLGSAGAAGGDRPGGAADQQCHRAPAVADQGQPRRHGRRRRQPDPSPAGRQPRRVGELATSFNRIRREDPCPGPAGGRHHQQLAGLVADVAQQAQRSEQAMGDQRGETDQVATAINEMTAAAQEVARSASAPPTPPRRPTARASRPSARWTSASPRSTTWLGSEQQQRVLDTLSQDVRGIVGVLK